MAVKRKLTTIFCADATHYGRMMARDESRTLARLQRYRAIMEEMFARHEGRMVNTWGDAIIAEFASVVEGVRCAVEIQEALTNENRDLPADEQMLFRIGINLGDVMIENGDMYGEGVNTAARLESLAEPGGILVSESVYNFAHRQLAIGFDFAGAKTAKPGDEPIAGYRVRIGGANRDESAEFVQPPQIAHPVAQSGEQAAQTPIRQAAAYIERFMDWLSVQDRSVKRSFAFIGFFLAINVLFTGIATPWFIFPSFPFALHIFLKMRKRNQHE